MNDVCRWKEEKSKIDGVYYYQTDCCTMTDKKPHENDFVCPYCKKPIEVIYDGKQPGAGAPGKEV